MTETPDQTPQPADTPGREAAKYRTRLREVEAERDALRDQVTAYQRADVERAAAEHLDKPEALWAVGVELADLLTDTGDVDPEKVRAATADAIDRLGLTRRTHGPIITSQGATPTKTPGPTFADAFAPRH